MRQTKILSGDLSHVGSLCRQHLFPVLVCLALAAQASAQSISVHRQGATVNDHLLGTSLWVSAVGLPLKTYQLALQDETGNVVASSMVTMDASGAVPAQVLWPKSGVQGCDAGAVWDTSSYKFRLFEDAEALAGRTFVVHLLNPNTGIPAATISLPLVANAGPFFYFSDAAGCPRFAFPDTSTDPVFVAGIRLPLGSPTTYNLKVTVGALTALNPQPVDIRPTYPNGQNLLLPGTQSTMVEPIVDLVDDEIMTCFQGEIPKWPPRDPTGNPEGSGNSSPGPLGFYHLHSAVFQCSDPRWPCPPCEEIP